MSIRKRDIWFTLTFTCAALLFGWLIRYIKKSNLEPFNGQRALQDVEIQVSFGARVPGSSAHAETINYIRRELRKAGWHVEIQETLWNDFPIKNILAFRGNKNTNPEVLIGAHYDSRLLADLGNVSEIMLPVPGANDGASGVAVLLELARTLPLDSVPVWLVFFDAEDNGRIGSWDWIIGSREFARNMVAKPGSVVVVDMVGDKDLTLFIEKNSDITLVNEIWKQAASLGYSQFQSEEKYAILDDHIPFLELGIPSVNIIDFDYPYYHTIHDTPDKVSAESLEAVGVTLWSWITNK